MGVLPKAKRAALRALELDPGIAEAHASLALISQYEFEWQNAETELRRAIKLKPDYPTAHQWYALMLEFMGRTRDGLAEAERAQRLDPTSPILNNTIGAARLYDRDFDGAVDALKKTLEMEPGFGLAHSTLGMVYVAQGKYAEAQAEFEKGPIGYADTYRGFTYAISGRRSDALRLVSDMEERAKREYVSPAARGLFWIALGEKDRGYSLLDRACAERNWQLTDVKVNPIFDTLRAEPRFKALLSACTSISLRGTRSGDLREAVPTRALSRSWIHYRHFPLPPRIPGEHFAMRPQRHAPVASVVVGHPREQEREVRVLLGLRRVLVRLPRALVAVAQADFFARIQEHQLGLPAERCADDLGVAALDDPAVVGSTELLEVLDDARFGSRDGDDVRLPDDGVEVENGDGSGGEALSEDGLTGAGVAEDGDAHAVKSLAADERRPKALRRLGVVN